MHRDTMAWRREYEKLNAFWIHDGNPKRPHALLTSGNHSNGFFNSKPIIADDKLINEVADDLLEKLPFSFILVDRFVGPATGATRLAEMLSLRIQYNSSRRDCFWSSPEKVGEGREKKLVFKDEEDFLSENVVLCEDVLTTGSSIELVAMAVKEKHGHIMPIVLVIVNRSGLAQLENFGLVLSLIDQPIPIWIPELCPLCRQKSEAICPKNPPENWARLNAKY